MLAKTSLALLAVLSSVGPLGAQAARLGTISFPNSGAKPAQRPFIRGVLLLHSFEYEDAAAAFRMAQRADPDFALAYWGEAMTLTHPVWNEQDLGAARAVLGRLAPTAEARRAKARTARERGYLEAVEMGLARAATAAGDTAAAAEAYAELRRIWHRADPDLPGLAEVTRQSAQAR